MDFVIHGKKCKTLFDAYSISARNSVYLTLNCATSTSKEEVTTASLSGEQQNGKHIQAPICLEKLREAPLMALKA